MKNQATVRVTVPVLLVVLAPLLLDGCVSIGVARAPAPLLPGSSGSVQVNVYKNRADQRRNLLAPLPVFSELMRLEGGRERSVARSMAPAWRLSSLPPGRYRLKVTKQIDSQGNVELLSHPGLEDFDLRAGEQLRLSVILRKTPVFWIVLAALTVIALIILSIDLAQHSDLPDLPPHTPIPLPPLPAVVDFDFLAGMPPERQPSPRLEVADSYPRDGASAVPRRLTISFLLSRPLADDGLGASAFQALGTESGEVGGIASYSAADQLVAFAPDRELQPGERVSVTLDLAKLTTPEGARGEGKFSTTFRVREIGGEKDE